MPNHDRYENNILRALQGIDESLDSIDKTLKHMYAANFVKKEKVDVNMEIIDAMNTVQPNNKED